MLKPGKRQLRDITDQELQVIVEMSHHYGCKDFWGNPVITDIDRNMFDNTIVIDYEQTRINDGEKSLTVMFFEYNSLTYHVDYRYPYARRTQSESITEDPKMLLSFIDQMQQEQPLPPGIENESRKKGWLDYSLTMSEIGLYRYNAIHRIKAHKEELDPLTIPNLYHVAEYYKAVGEEVVCCCLQRYCMDFRFDQEDVREIISKEE